MIGCFDVSGNVSLGRYYNLYNVTFLYSSPNIFLVIKSRSMS